MAAQQHHAKLTSATLQHVTDLSNQAQRLLRHQQGRAQAHEDSSLDDLQRELAQLKRRKAALAAKLQQRSLASTLAPAADASAAAGNGTQDDTLQLSLSLHERLSAAAARNAKRRKVCEVQIAYRLAGHSVFPLSATRSGIRFETSYNGAYFEQYYVILDLASDQGKIYRHTLPPLVPLRELAPYVAKDLARFISAVSDYLNAYVARRQQLVELTHAASLLLHDEPEASVNVDTVRFAVNVAPLPDSGHDSSENEEEDNAAMMRGAPASAAGRVARYRVYLHYSDLLSTLPDTVQIRLSGAEEGQEPQAALRRAEKAFRTFVPAIAIHRAFASRE